MKLLQTFVVAGLLMCTAVRADADNQAAPQLDSSVRRLREQLNLTEQQTQELDKIFKEIRANREVLITELRNISKKRDEQMNAILTQEQRELYEKKSWEVPERPGHPERSEP